MTLKNQVRYDRNHVITRGRTYVMNNGCAVKVTSIWVDRHSDSVSYVVVADSETPSSVGRNGDTPWNSFYYWVDWDASNATRAA